MICPNCNQDVEPVQIGSTVGGTPLAGCPKCGVVIWSIEVEKLKDEKEKGKT